MTPEEKLLAQIKIALKQAVDKITPHYAHRYLNEKERICVSAKPGPSGPICEIYLEEDKWARMGAPTSTSANRKVEE